MACLLDLPLEKPKSSWAGGLAGSAEPSKAMAEGQTCWIRARGLGGRLGLSAAI
jgi:hypothetical protein